MNGSNSASWTVRFERTSYSRGIGLCSEYVGMNDLIGLDEVQEAIKVEMLQKWLNDHACDIIRCFSTRIGINAEGR